jgi:tRNA(fMet)-specific endonuclease VapC
MNTIALDTNIAVDVLNGKGETIGLLQGYEVLCLPVTVCGELLFGAINSANRAKNENKYRTFIESCVILDSNSLVAEEYAEVRLSLKQKGRPIPENDIWIAAACIVNGIPLMSRDKHFNNIEKLQLIKAE